MASIHRQRGRPHWFCAFTDAQGRRHFVSTKTSSKRQALVIARARAKAALLTARDQFNPEAARRILSAAMEDMLLVSGANMPRSTPRAWFERWLDSKAVDAESATLARYRVALQDFQRHLGDKAQRDLTALSPEDVLDYRNATSKRLAASTVNTNLRAVRACLNDAVRLDLLSRNPAVQVPLAKEQESKRRPFTADELRRLIAACEDSEWRGLVLCGLYTGQRLGDIASLQWRQVDLASGMIRFVTQKTGTRLELPMARPLQECLLALPAADDPSSPVFPEAARRASISTANLSDAFYREVLTPAGLVPPRPKKSEGSGKGRSGRRELSPVSFHSLRHNFTSLLKRVGASEALAGLIVGHASKEISRHYTHLTGVDASAYIAKLPEVE